MTIVVPAQAALEPGARVVVSVPALGIGHGRLTTTAPYGLEGGWGLLAITARGAGGCAEVVLRNSSGVKVQTNGNLCLEVCL